ncbi:MAG: PLP-dependent transferase [Armatimonadota bacterium]|nr:PLP-dependent transferase [Armatimonadota bacterium]
MDIETMVLHGGYKPDPQTGSTAEPIHQTTAYAYAKADEISDVFRGYAPGYIYSRLANPTSSALERRLTELEEGVGCLTTASGMAAIASVAMGLTRAGDHIVASRGLFGGTISFFVKTLGRFGVETSFVDAEDTDGFRGALKTNTKFIFVETIGNPKMDVPDIPAAADIAHAACLPLVVDSTLTTPVLIRPKEFGADIVIHSLSKFINGHGNSIGGAIIDTGNYDWANGAFADIRELAAKAGKLAFLAHLRMLIYRDLGCCPSPFNSFMHLTGIEGLTMRMERHCQNAQALAEWLAAHPNVKGVEYPGLASNAYHETANKLFGGRYGAMLTFRLGSKDAAMKFIDATELAQNLANLGDSKTLIIHPASTIFSEFAPEERERMGAPDDLIRVSVGIESVKDIIADFDSALQSL